MESRSLTVQWGTVPCPDQRGLITGYRLQYSNGTSIVNTTGEGSRQHVLTGLTPFTNYSVQVAAVNAGVDWTILVHYSYSLWRHCRIVSNEQIIIVPLLLCVPVQFLVQCLVCQPLQEWSSSQSHGLLPQNLDGVMHNYPVTHNSTGVLYTTAQSATVLLSTDTGQSLSIVLSWACLDIYARTAL